MEHIQQENTFSFALIGYSITNLIRRFSYEAKYSNDPLTKNRIKNFVNCIHGLTIELVKRIEKEEIKITGSLEKGFYITTDMGNDKNLIYYYKNQDTNIIQHNKEKKKQQKKIKYNDNAWISPLGKEYPCIFTDWYNNGHVDKAEEIVKELGIKLYHYDAERYLEKQGWIKVSNGDFRMTNHEITISQYNYMCKYCEYNSTSNISIFNKKYNIYTIEKEAHISIIEK